jgi:hypothetical protein
MALVKKDLNAVSDAITLQVPPDRTAVAGFQYPTGGTGTLIPEGTLDELTWHAISVTPIGGGAGVVSIAAAGIWYADVSYLHKIRLRKSASAGACIASVIMNHP